jgi:prepilin-type processing-associated H-X9-DG protein
VVIGIIAVLIGVLLPALARARANANDLKCASNVRQLCTSLLMYASANKGKFPPNLNAGAMYPVPPPQLPNYSFWYDYDRIGKYLPNTVEYSTGSIGGNVFICPNDFDSARSYAINIWSSCVCDQFILNVASNGWIYNPTAGPNLAAADRGTLFSSNIKGAQDIILISEKFSVFGPPGTFAAGSTIGYQGTLAGTRFVGDLSIPTGGRFGVTPTELDFGRHRRRDDRGTGVEAKGRINIGFVDGHVAMFQADQLADRTSKKSKLVALWSPYDRIAP